MQVMVNGVRLFVEVFGQKLSEYGSQMVERPTVVALHGGPSDHAHMRSMIEPDTQRLFDRFLDELRKCTRMPRVVEGGSSHCHDATVHREVAPHSASVNALAAAHHFGPCARPATKTA